MTPSNAKGTESQTPRKLHIKIVLEYKGKRYEFIDDHSSFTFDGADTPSDYWWEEGNGACDCNRALYINRNCDKEFPEMTCGDTIDLVSQEFIGDWTLGGREDATHQAGGLR
jgi:hypothetical protein